MNSLNFAVLTAQALGSLLVAVLLALLHRSYKRPFLLYWSYSWAALAIYTASGVVAIQLSQIVPASHPARLIQSVISISAALQASVWLLFGTFALARERKVPRRVALRCWLGVSLVAVVVTAGTLRLPAMLRYGVRVSLPELVLAIALTVAAWRVWAQSHPATRRRASTAGARADAVRPRTTAVRGRRHRRLPLRIAVSRPAHHRLRRFLHPGDDRARAGHLAARGRERSARHEPAPGRARARRAASERGAPACGARQHRRSRLHRQSSGRFDASIARVRQPATSPTCSAIRRRSFHGRSRITGSRWCIPDDVQPLLARTRAILASGEPGTREYRARHKKTGECRWVEDRIVPSCDASGYVPGDLRRRSRRHRTQARRAGAARVRGAGPPGPEKMEAVGRLAGGIAHDFNNLLMAISGHTEMLLDMFGPADERRREAQEIAKAAARAADLTRQLLAFSRSEAIKPRSLDVNDLVRGLERMLDRLIPENVHLTTALDPGRRRLGGSGAGGAGDRQPRRERARRAAHGRRHSDHHARGRRRIGRCRDARRRPAGRRPLHRARRARQRLRHRSRAAAAYLRAVLHHQGIGQGHRPRPVHRLQHRPAERRIGGPRERPRRDDVSSVFSARRSGAGTRRQPAARLRRGAGGRRGRCRARTRRARADAPRLRRDRGARPRRRHARARRGRRGRRSGRPQESRRSGDHRLRESGGLGGAGARAAARATGAARALLRRVGQRGGHGGRGAEAPQAVHARHPGARRRAQALSETSTTRLFRSIVLVSPSLSENETARAFTRSRNSGSVASPGST